MKRFLQCLLLTLCAAYADCRAESEFDEPVTINITMTIPQLIGPVPTGGNLDVTPFAIAPNGKLIEGAPTNIVPQSALIQSLNPVVVEHPKEGNYVIGYFMSLGPASPVFSVNTIANFSGLVLNNPVGDKFQTITIPIQTLFLSSLATANDVLTVTANFPIVHIGQCGS